MNKLNFFNAFEEGIVFNFFGNFLLSTNIFFEKYPSSWTSICDIDIYNIGNLSFKIKNDRVGLLNYSYHDNFVSLTFDISKFIGLNEWINIVLLNISEEKILYLFINSKLVGHVSTPPHSKILDISAPFNVKASRFYDKNSIKATLGGMHFIDLNNIDICHIDSGIFVKNCLSFNGIPYEDTSILPKNTELSQIKESIIDNNLNYAKVIYLFYKSNKHINDSYLTLIKGMLGDFANYNSNYNKKLPGFKINLHIDINGYINDISKLKDTVKKNNINNIRYSENFGRFGNGLWQLLHILLLANYLEIKNIYISNLWYLTDGKNSLSNGATLYNGLDDLSVFGSTLDVDYYIFYMHKIAAKFDMHNIKYHDIYDTYVKDIISLNTHKKLGENDLVVYIRSGDIFHNPHHDYGQPPLAFYKKIIQSRAWRKIYCVFECKSNPVIQPLINYISELKLPVEEISGNLIDDIEFLLQAVNLVAANGTFIWAVTTISQNLKNLYCFESLTKINGSVNHTYQYRQSLNIFVLHDKLGYYVDNIMNHNWENSDFQRNLMISYEDFNIEEGRLL